MVVLLAGSKKIGGISRLERSADVLARMTSARAIQLADQVSAFLARPRKPSVRCPPKRRLSSREPRPAPRKSITRTRGPSDAGNQVFT